MGKTPVVTLDRILASATFLVMRYVENNKGSYIKEAWIEDDYNGARTFNMYFLVGQKKPQDMYKVSFDVDGTHTAVLKSTLFIGGKNIPVLEMYQEFHVIFPHAGRKGKRYPCFVPKHWAWEGVENGTDIYYEQAKKKQKERLEKKRKEAAVLVSLLQQKGTGGA